jgi:hypothetical protein
MLLWYFSTCVKVSNIKGSTFKGEWTLSLDLGLSLMCHIRKLIYKKNIV